MSSKILRQEDNILRLVSDSLSAMRRRPAPKDILSRRMKAGNHTPTTIARRASEKGLSVSEGAIKFILTGETKNPSIFTLEAIAAGMDIPALELLAEFLGERADEPNVKGSQFTNLSELYKELTTNQKGKADPFIDGLRLQMLHIKNQK